MRIIDKINKSEQFFSIEFFPPKERDKWPRFFEIAEKLKAVRPLFASVTYGAGGSTRDHTLEIVARLKAELGLEPMAHLTCVGAEEGYIRSFLAALRAADVDNVLALRGDPPKGEECFIPADARFRHASDLVSFIREAQPELGVGVAGYPEVHPEAGDAESDMWFLRAKLDKGADFVVTQLFFDNDKYFGFVNAARASGIGKPILPGILPILSKAGVERIVSMCGASMPADLLAAIDAADARGGAEAVRAVGVAHARAQIEDLLARGVPGVHLYTLNSDVMLEIVHGLAPCSRPRVA
ncbi:MAG: methylenetetrahydrofolate reductase [Desulfovibrionaceae bacterium]|jgi:methylenetetrahydrofolate reductase (NADPH)|nr:methylenetetrahydrofolate reductase [Desulfovibrionaceae bacterium]